MIYNGKIKKFYLGTSDYGRVSTYVDVECGDGTYQGFGPYMPGDKLGKFVTRVLDISEAGSWDQVVGKPIRIDREDGLIVGIGHYINNDWFYPRSDL